MFVFSLFAEFIANDKPIIAYYKGEVLFPVLIDYPESKFGGFLAVTDYKDQEILKEIESNGWAIWPPIGYSYHSINKDYPRVKNAAGSAWASRRRRRGRRAPTCASARRPARALRPSATATGSAPTIRAATCWRA